MASYKIKQIELDIGIFELIRRELVSRGHLADVELYDLTTDPGLDAYNAANAAIDELVEVFNVGGAKSRGDKEVNTIVLDRAAPRMATSGVGKGVDYDYNPDTGKYEKTRPADLKYDVPYTITYFCEHTYQADIIEDVIRHAVNDRAYVESLDEDVEVTGHFYLIRQGQFDVSDENFIERGFTYLARNIDLRGANDEGEITPFDIDQFELEILAKKPNGEYTSFNTITCKTTNVGLLFVIVELSGNGDLYYNGQGLVSLSLDENGDLSVEILDPSVSDAYVDNGGDLILFIDE